MENIKEQMVEKMKIKYPELNKVPQKFIKSDFIKSEKYSDCILTIVVHGAYNVDIYECHYYCREYHFNNISCAKHLLKENIFLTEGV